MCLSMIKKTFLVFLQNLLFRFFFLLFSTSNFFWSKYFQCDAFHSRSRRSLIRIHLKKDLTALIRNAGFARQATKTVSEFISAAAKRRRPRSLPTRSRIFAWRRFQLGAIRIPRIVTRGNCRSFGVRGYRIEPSKLRYHESTDHPANKWRYPYERGRRECRFFECKHPEWGRAEQAPHGRNDCRRNSEFMGL